MTINPKTNWCVLSWRLLWPAIALAAWSSMLLDATLGVVTDTRGKFGCDMDCSLLKIFRKDSHAE